jgi:hypothetical protein
MCRVIGERCVSEGSRIAKFAVTAILSYINPLTAELNPSA